MGDPFFKPPLGVKQTGEKCLEQSLELEVIYTSTRLEGIWQKLVHLEKAEMNFWGFGKECKEYLDLADSSVFLIQLFTKQFRPIYSCEWFAGQINVKITALGFTI